MKFWLLSMLFLAQVSCTPANGASRPTPSPAPPSTPTVQAGPRLPAETIEVPQITDSALKYIVQSGEFRVGVLYNYPPFSYRANNGTLHGYELDLTKKIAEKWGVKAVFVQVTRQTRVPFLIDGTVDAVVGAMPHERQTDQYLQFSDTTFMSGTVAMVSNDSGIDSVSSLGSTPIGVVGPDIQAQVNQFMSSLGQSPTVLEFGSIDDAIAAYQVGTVSSIIGRREDLMRATTILHNEKILSDYISSQPYAFAVRKGDAPLRDLINLTLQDIAKSGQLGELFSSNLYGYADNFTVMRGDAVVNAASFPTAVSHAESTVKRLARGEALRVAGFDLSQSPLPFDSQPIVDGYNRAVINEIARRWNVPVKEIPQSVGDTGVAMVQVGEADLAVSILPDVALIGRVGFSQPYYVRSLRMIHLQAVTIFGIDDLNYKDVAVVDPTDLSTDLVTKNSEFSHIEPLSSPMDAFNRLAAGSFFAIVGDEYSTFLMAKADNRIIVYPRRFRPREFSLGYSPNDPDFESLVNFTLQDMQADGTLDRLISQYFGPYTPPDEPPDRIVMERWPGTSNFIGVGGY